MGVRERREREKTATRDLILEAARELFVSEGYDGVSMRKVAEKIEYSPTAIYVHFADKEQLFRELCHEDFAKLAEVFVKVAEMPDPLERLRAIGGAYIEFGLRYPNHYRLMFMDVHAPLRNLDERDLEVKENPEKDAYAFLKQTVVEGLEKRLFREGVDDAELISQTLWAAVHGVISLEIAKRNDAWVEWRPMEDRAFLMLDSVLRGMVKGRR